MECDGIQLVSKLMVDDDKDRSFVVISLYAVPRKVGQGRGGLPKHSAKMGRTDKRGRPKKGGISAEGKGQGMDLEGETEKRQREDRGKRKNKGKGMERGKAEGLEEVEKREKGKG
jgi:hypothetical protein